MSHREFNELLSSPNGLSPEQLARLRHALDSKIASSRPVAAKRDAMLVEETVFDVRQRSGLVGCIKGTPGTPTDLATNPDHMQGFGNG